MAGSNCFSGGGRPAQPKDKRGSSEDAETAFRIPSGARPVHYEKQLASLFKALAKRPINKRDYGQSHSVFICFTNRSGSNLLAEALNHCGVMPRAREYFNIPSVKKFVEERGLSTFGEFCGRLAVERGASGLFSSKVGLSQIMLLCDKGMVGKVFLHPCFIHVKRNDLLGQAISFSIADQTKSWTWNQRPKREPIFDRADIDRKITGISTANARFEEFFAINGIVPYRITYEDFIDAPQAEIDGIAHWLGRPSGRFSRDRVKVRQQADARNLEWKQRFLDGSAGL